MTAYNELVGFLQDQARATSHERLRRRPTQLPSTSVTQHSASRKPGG